ncbi:MAG TPA: aminotransferase class V-fold PLP-dependent enzyme [Acidimicrobiales bacterium]|nr:aminotransferase class V-fold PLP-dependent enzyme [Acidimicrobiales bacterium]
MRSNGSSPHPAAVHAARRIQHPLLDPPAASALQVASLEDAVGALLETRHDVVLFPAEAALPLEALARGLGGPGIAALNVASMPFGAAFGRWLERTGSRVVELRPPPDRAVDPEEIARALRANPDVSVVTLVHAEAATGVRHDLLAIASLVRQHGAVFLLDVVASLGAHEVALDAWDVDCAVIGPQKALAGPSGVSLAVVSPRGWDAMVGNGAAPRDSILSLLDWREQWIDAGRTAVRGTPPPLEILALEAALERIVAEGLPGVRRRHEAAAAASRAGAAALGLAPFAPDAEAAFVATTLRAPAATDARQLVEMASARGRVALSAGYGSLATGVLRLDHTGQRARLPVVVDALVALGRALDERRALDGSIPEAVEAAKAAWRSCLAQHVPTIGRRQTQRR